MLRPSAAALSFRMFQLPIIGVAQKSKPLPMIKKSY